MAQVYFEEIQVKSVINRVQAPDMGLKWTINPYRGCQHACVYCFASSRREPPPGQPRGQLALAL